jgi:hypothetical protein
MSDGAVSVAARSADVNKHGNNATNQLRRTVLIGASLSRE